MFYEAVIGASVGVYTIHAEIVSFFLSHADQLKLYFTYVYEQYPAVKIIFNFLQPVSKVMRRAVACDWDGRGGGA